MAAEGCPKVLQENPMHTKQLRTMEEDLKKKRPESEDKSQVTEQSLPTTLSRILREFLLENWKGSCKK